MKPSESSGRIATIDESSRRTTLTGGSPFEDGSRRRSSLIACTGLRSSAITRPSRSSTSRNSATRIRLPTRPSFQPLRIARPPRAWTARQPSRRPAPPRSRRRKDTVPRRVASLTHKLPSTGAAGSTTVAAPVRWHVQKGAGVSPGVRPAPRGEGGDLELDDRATADSLRRVGRLRPDRANDPTSACRRCQRPVQSLGAYGDAHTT
jgi:hypothetical protein